ncbi:uncharacterized protein LOC136084684 [Hydra vulgaris]|uniref:uncharacterized protein LOC136084684 n=1 Tax=Hydra vulgaris TaxID=6087 RepID=UPI0032EA181A
MSPSTFKRLLQIVAHDITKNTTKMRKPICAQERLAITVRYLATGDAHTRLAANYRMSPTTVGRIVHETCNAIWNNLLREYVKTPNSEIEWEKIAYEFETRWHFPHCVGAIDGKHVQMMKHVHMMKPYAFKNLLTDKLIFNYRLSRARRVVENAFGIASSRFRVFHKPIIANVENVIAITKAVVALHNFLMTENVNNNNTGQQRFCAKTFGGHFIGNLLP